MKERRFKSDEILCNALIYNTLGVLSFFRLTDLGTNVKQQYLALKAQLNSDPNNTQLLNQVLQKEEEKENIVAWFVRDAINNGNVF